MGFLELLKSKTVWGALIALLGWLATPDGLGLMADIGAPTWLPKVIIAIGTVLGAIGIRAAIAKSGPTT